MKVINKKALLIGINYFNTENELSGCINDVHNIALYLTTKAQFKPCDIDIYTDDTTDGIIGTTYDGIINNLNKLALSSWTDKLDLIYIHYSGHGAQQVDTNNDEPDGLDECICPSDCDTKGFITDDTLNTILCNSFNPKTRVRVVFDACHSGSALDLQYSCETSDKMKIINNKLLKGDIILISGCRDIQTSADSKYDNQAAGALTHNLLNVLNNINYNICALSLLDKIHESFKIDNTPQYPLLSSSKKITKNTLFF